MTDMRLRVRALTCAAFMCFACLASPTAWANSAAPWDEGDPLTEPMPQLEGLAIVDERLVVDLSHLAATDRGKVTATYRIDNPGAARDVPLWFTTPGMGPSAITLDGAAVPSSPIAANLPAEWKGPTATPSPGGGDHHFEYEGEARTIAFTAPIPTGESELVVTYEPTLGRHHGDRAYVDYQFVYALAPARAWGRFDRLTIDVTIPEDWGLTASLALEPKGAGTYRMTSDGLPEGDFAMTLRPPPPSFVAPLLRYGPLALFAALGAVLGVAGGRRARRGGWGGMARLGFAAILIPLAMIAVAVGYYIGELAFRTVVDERLLAHGAYDNLILAALIALLAAVAAVAALDVTLHRYAPPPLDASLNP